MKSVALSWDIKGQNIAVISRGLEVAGQAATLRKPRATKRSQHFSAQEVDGLYHGDIAISCTENGEENTI